MTRDHTRGTIYIAPQEAVPDDLKRTLAGQGFLLEPCPGGEELVRRLRSRSGGALAVVLDFPVRRIEALETMRSVRSLVPDVPIIVVSDESAPKDVVDAMRNGASDFVGKPIDPEVLTRAIRTAIQDATRAHSISSNGREKAFRTTNPQMREIEDLADQIGWSEAPTLIRGETGTGKEVLARLLHSRSPRAGRPLVKLNCAALPSDLVESELFGYERGAFTGAFQKKLGMFEMAHGGTILLDEIGDMDFKLQAKLLQVLQDHTFHRLGGQAQVQVDVRVMCATHRDLEDAIIAGTFRQDLYYRLNVVSLHLPPLRERKEDILGLAEVFLRKHATPGTPLPSVPESLRQALMAHDWPGNIRELENVMRKLLVLQAPEMLAAELRHKAARKVHPMPVAVPKAQSGGQDPTLEQVTKAKEQAESEAILAALQATRWNRKAAASILKIEYKALLYRMRKLQIEGLSRAV